MRRLGFFSKKNSVSFSAEKLSGVVAPLVTPLNADNSVDLISLKNLIARLQNKGVQNFFVFGSFGEYEQLSIQNREEILRTAGSEIAGRGLLLAGCFAKTVEESIALVNSAAKYADACVVNVPSAALSHELAFADFFEALMRFTKQKILLYNNPFLFNGSIPVAWLENFINWENFVGVINASRNHEYFTELSKLVTLTKLFDENEEFAFDALRGGFSGLFCISSLLFPSYYLQLIANFDGLDYGMVMRNEAKVSALSKMILPAKRIQAVKYVLALQGIIQPFYFDALEPLNEKELVIINEMVKRLRKSRQEKVSV